MDFEKDFAQFAKHEDTRNAARSARGKQGIKACDAADELLASLRAKQSEYLDELDAAAQSHATICEPLQAELADPATSADRRITCRMGINVANAELSATSERIKPLLKAIEDEIELARIIVGSRVAVENAYFLESPPEVRERLWILEKAEAALKSLAFSAGKAADAAASTLADEKARRQQGESKYSSLEELERAARVTAGVAEIVSAPLEAVRAERNSIRERRIKELYS